MDNNTIQQIKDTIAQSNSIGITAPINPSVDEMAAALSLYLILKSSGKNVSIASPKDPLVEVSSLVGINKVEKTLKGSGGGTGDLTVSFPYTEGEIEKVSYTLEEGYLNIIVKASEQGLTFDEKDVEYTRGSTNLDLVFTVGTKNLADLDPVFDTQNLDIKIVNIDNKEDNEQFGDIVLISPKLSSLSEAVADLALSLGLNIDQDSAQNLLNGISSATGNFQDTKTSSLAFEMAALLMKKGAQREASASARQGIRQPEEQAQQQARPQQRNAQQQPQQQPQKRAQNPVAGQEKTFSNAQDKREQDRIKFEENLQKRVAEEKAREAQAGQAKPQRQASQPQNQPVNNQVQDADIVDDEETPTDWLAPKVYKGSSEV